MQYTRLWIALAVVIIGSFAVLGGVGMRAIRQAPPIPQQVVSAAGRVRFERSAMFFWWTAWAASTNRPGQEVTYTQNWPHEPLVGNTPTGSAVVWSVISFVLLLAGVGGMVWYFAAQERGPAYTELPTRDPLLGLEPTPSQFATVKYFFVVVALFVVQVGFGAIAAHYGVEGSGFYGIPFDQWLPYAVARTWHTQLGLFWIATSWLATGLYVAPTVSRYEPPGQRTGVNLLFIALLIVVVGSLLGEWLGIKQYLGKAWFWFGSQGYEYVDLGRFWQILLFVGLCFWLGLMGRALRPALARRADQPCLAGALSHRQHRYSTVLCRRAYVRAAESSGHGRVLAVVGGAPLGRGLFRGLCHGGDRVSVHPLAAPGGVNSDPHDALLHRDLPGGRHHWHVPPSLFYRDAEQRTGVGRNVQRP
jgi:nitric oxide reductase large subunit